MESLSFVGREDVLSAVQERFTHGDRLVTLVGEAGIGKSRVARRIAFESSGIIASTLGEGAPVHWCACETARDETAMLRALADSLEITLQNERPIEYLCDTLSQRSGLLLVLDHVDGPMARALVQRLIQSCPELCVLATSRASLGCENETCVTVGPLDDESALRLWSTSGGRKGDPESVRAIHTLVGGSPLALEIVARTPGNESFATRRKSLSACVSAAATPLMGAFAFAFAALDPPARRNFAEASVFAGGFTLEAAAAVFTSDRDTPLAMVLGDLQARGLLRLREASGVREVRFELESATREFAARELERLGASASTFTRHSAWYLAQAREWVIDHAWRGAPTALDHLIREYENLSLVAERTVEGHGAPVERAVSRLLALTYQLPVVMVWGAAWPHFDRIERALEAAVTAGATDADVAPARFACAWRHRLAARYEQAAVATERVIATARDIGCTDLHAHALCMLAALHAEQGRVAEALSLADRSMIMLEELGRHGESVWSMALVAKIRLSDRAFDEARSGLVRALARSREHGNVYAEGDVLLLLSEAELARGNHDHTRRYLTEAAAVLTRTRRTAAMVSVRHALARLQHELGQTDTAVAEYQRAIELAAFLGDHHRVARIEVDLAVVLHEVGQFTEARATLERAVVTLSKRDAASTALAHAYLAAVHASCGNFDAADAEASAARVVAVDDNDKLIVRALHAYVAFSRARELPMPDARNVTREARHEVTRLKTIPIDEQGIELRISMRLLAGFDGDELLRPSADLARPQAMVAHRTGQWFIAPAGAEVSLRTRSTLSVLLRRLGEQRSEAPGRSLSPESLIADMWPGEKIIPKAARNRLHVAIRTLRTMGLNRILRSDIDGYHLDPAVPFQFVGEEEATP